MRSDKQAPTKLQLGVIAFLVLLLWIFLYPKPHDFVMLLCLVLAPSAAVVLAKKGQLKAGVMKPAAVVVLYPLALSFAWRAFADYDFLHAKPVFFSVAAGALLVSFIIVVGFAQFRSAEAFFPGLVGAIYLFGAVLALNCLLDPLPATQFETRIEQKYISGKYRDRYVRLAPWGPRAVSESVMVKSDFYESVAEGEIISVNLKPGIFNISWFYLARDHK